MSHKALSLLVSTSVFLGGFAVLVTEILGVRLVSPVFGAGLYAWAALLSTALAALALGYWVGGRLADRRPEPRTFFSVVVAAGTAVALIPLYAPAVVPAFEAFGLRLGSLLAAVATFLPPLFLLGLLSPFAVRISAERLAGVGRTAGSLYALSTLGSVAGTLAAGFLLEPVLRIGTTLTLSGVALALPGLAGLLLASREAAMRGAAVLALAVFLPPLPGDEPEGDLVFRADTPFSRVEVVDHAGERWLLLDGTVHTHMEVGGVPVVSCGYVRRLGMLPGFRPDARSLLVLGLGGGALLPVLDPEDYEVTVVEVDPIVVEVARDLFGTLDGDERVVVEDARTFVRRGGGPYDLVALDVCGACRMPEHLSTLEFFREVKAVMAPDGVLGTNAIGPPGGRTLAAFQRTLGEVFRNVRAWATEGEGGVMNAVFFASDGPLELSWAYEGEWEHARADYPGGTVLTDAYNPVNFWNAPHAARVRPSGEDPR